MEKTYMVADYFQKGSLAVRGARLTGKEVVAFAQEQWSIQDGEEEYFPSDIEEALEWLDMFNYVIN